MAKKKKGREFGWLDAVETAGQVASAFAAYKSAKADIAKADTKTAKAFEDGNKTNPEGAQGGKSVQRASGSGTKVRNPGNSQLNTDFVDPPHRKRNIYSA